MGCVCMWGEYKQGSRKSLVTEDEREYVSKIGWRRGEEEERGNLQVDKLLFLGEWRFSGTGLVGLFSWFTGF